MDTTTHTTHHSGDTMNAYTYAMTKVFQLFRQSLEGNMDYETVYRYAEIVNMLDFLAVLEALLDIGVIDFQPTDDDAGKFKWFLTTTC